MICHWLERITTVFGGQGGTRSEVRRRAAFEQLFRNSFVPIYRYVRYQVPTDEAAIDVVHLVFYRIWTRQVVLDPSRPPLPYLCTLARRALVEYLDQGGAEDRLAIQDRHAAESDAPPPKDAER